MAENFQYLEVTSEKRGKFETAEWGVKWEWQIEYIAQGRKMACAMRIPK